MAASLTIQLMNYLQFHGISQLIVLAGLPLPKAYRLLQRRGHATTIHRNTLSIMQMCRCMLLKINSFEHNEPPPLDPASVGCQDSAQDSAGVHKSKAEECTTVLLLMHLNKDWRGQGTWQWYYLTSKSIYSTITCCYVNSATPIFISIFLLHMPRVVHSSALELCSSGLGYRLLFY